MDESLRIETEKLARSWAQHESSHLRDYLVAGVEDPRLNLQSIITRHFLIGELCGARFEQLMDEECRFGVVMNWLASLGPCLTEPDTRNAILHALNQDADNAEGIPIPEFVTTAFRSLPKPADSLPVPNYLESFLTRANAGAAWAGIDDATLETFCQIWGTALGSIPKTERDPPTVLEAACGSANEYRFLHSYRIASLMDYAGFDLCDKNTENARAMFPDARFATENVFEIHAPDKSFDLCFFHDLLEHLSLDGMRIAVKELCRVTRRALCIGFFQIHEGPEHVIRVVDDYHWNTLSLPRTRMLFLEHGFQAQVIHIATFLREKFGCHYTHNPNAYTLVLRRIPPPASA